MVKRVWILHKDGCQKVALNSISHRGFLCWQRIWDCWSQKNITEKELCSLCSLQQLEKCWLHLYCGLLKKKKKKQNHKNQPKLEIPESIFKQTIKIYTNSDVEHVPTSYFLNENFPFTKDWRICMVRTLLQNLGFKYWSAMCFWSCTSFHKNTQHSFLFVWLILHGIHDFC